MANWINLLEVVYPIGSIYQSTKSTSPSQLIGGTWKQITEKFLFAAGENYACGQTGGEVEHILSPEEAPETIPLWYGSKSVVGQKSTLTNTALWTTGQHLKSEHLDVDGGGQPHNNMPPYYVIYIWERIS